MNKIIHFTLNGDPVEALAPVNMTMVDFLRKEMHLTGTKRGCEEGECGACTILLDGRAVPSCIMLAMEADGHEITTIEGVRKNGVLHSKIRDQDEFDAYMAKMTLKGFGGTDFRPVFEHVDMLIKQHEFTNLKGIIYFTDGYGTFPPMPPEYETAFVFLDNGREIPDTPPWAIRIRMTDSDIEQLPDR